MKSTSKNSAAATRAKASSSVKKPKPKSEAGKSAEDTSSTYVQLFESAPLGQLVLGADGTILLINRAAAHWIGVEGSRLKGRKLATLLDGAYRPAFKSLLKEVFASETKSSCELRLAHAPRRTGHIFRLEVMPSSDGLTCHALMHDVTEQKETEATLRESDHFNRATIDALQALVVVLDADGVILASNSAWRNFADARSSNWRVLSEGRNYLKVCEQSAAAGCADAGKALVAIREVIAGKRQSWSYEYPCHFKDEQSWFICHVSRLTGEGPVRVVVAHENISAVKLAQEAQRESAERLRLAVQAANLGLWDWDMVGGRVEFSPVWKKQLGHAEDEIGHGFNEWEDRLHPEDRAGAVAHLRRYLARPEGPHMAEFRLRHKDGTWRWIYTRAEIFRDSAGKPVRMVGCHLDVTEQRQLTEQVLRTQRMEAIGTLAGGVAHDLNNILAPTLLVTEMIRRKTTDPELLRLVGMIDDGTKRGAHIIRQVLVFSRGTQGQRTQLHAGRLLRDLETLVRETFPREITLKLSITPRLHPILADATQIHQVLMNLCINARDAMSPGGGQLTLSARNVDVTSAEALRQPHARPGPHVLLEVTDTGQGIDPGVIDRIFDPFFTTKDVGQGTGLGLSTALGIVHSHQGFITVASRPGAGAVFRVYLPASGSSPAALVEEPKTNAGPRGNGETVLVVDDEPLLLETTRLILESNGYSVLTACDGHHALARADEVEGVGIDLVFTDITMPEMGGVELIRALREKWPRIPVLVASGHLHDARNKELASLGVREVLQKPCVATEILEAVKRLLSVRGKG